MTRQPNTVRNVDDSVIKMLKKTLDLCEQHQQEVQSPGGFDSEPRCDDVSSLCQLYVKLVLLLNMRGPIRFHKYFFFVWLERS